MIRFTSALALAASISGAAVPTTAIAQETYREPAAEVSAILDAPRPPEAAVSPDGKWMVLTDVKGMAAIEDRAVPMQRLAGVRVNTATNGPYDADAYDTHSSYTGTGTRYRLINLETDAAVDIAAPDTKLGPPIWAPDSSQFAFLHTTRKGIELWVADVSTGQARALTGATINVAGSISYTSGAPCVWTRDSSSVICQTIPADRGPVPEKGVPAGPSVQQADGEETPVWTFTNLLTNEYDERLFDYYMTSQPMKVDVASGAATPFAEPGIYESLTPSEDGQYYLASKVTGPYSYIVPASRFPKSVEILSSDGALVKTVAETTLNTAGPESMGWAPSGERGHQWRPSETPALFYVETLDGGNPKVEAEFRDRVMMLEAPFTGAPKEVMRTTDRIVSSGPGWYALELFAFTQGGSEALVKQFAWATRDTHMWLIDATGSGAQAERLWSHNDDDWYGEPGSPATTSAHSGTLRQDGDWIYLSGQGGSPDGDHPFLDRFNLETRQTERLFATSGENYEQVVAILDDEARTIVTRYETSEQPANFILRDLEGSTSTALTQISRPQYTLPYSSKEQVNYTRSDGVPLSGTLYLPVGYTEGETVPTIIWAYPREFANKQGAGQVRGTSYAYPGPTDYMGDDYKLFLTQGYAVLADAAMPIVGGLEANDTYVEQLVANAQAAVDMLVDKGVADRDRVGIAGHSYGAFMTANLLAHSDIFATGYALSGAYNRTLTPFGFQRERRTYWEAPEVYQAMSPFMHATEINEPILLFHGEIDSNTGTYPIQSQRLFQALSGLGATAKLEMMPYEDHRFYARESRLHVLAEAFDWFEKYLEKEDGDED